MSTHVSRRTFLLGTGLAGSMSMLPGCGKNSSAMFLHGVASGDPLHDRVVLWTRVTPAGVDHQSLRVRWQVAVDGAFRQVVSSGEAVADAERDFTVKVDAAGLQPGGRYFYRFIAGDVISPVGRTRTLPAGKLEELALAVVSCSNYGFGYFNVYAELAANPDFYAVLHLGDYLYEYASGAYDDPALAAARPLKPATELLSLDDYRTRHALYRTDPHLQAAHAAHPFICVWDDHEVANDTWRGGAENHQPDEGDWLARRDAAIRAYREWLPIRDGVNVASEVAYRRFAFGDLVRLIMLDTRVVGRDKQLSYQEDMVWQPQPEVEAFKTQKLLDGKRSMLGAEQEQWLERELALSKQEAVPWQVLGQQVLMGKLVGIGPDDGLDLSRVNLTEEQVRLFTALAKLGLPLYLDTWDGYWAARERLFQALREYANNAVVLTGDSHNAWGFELVPAGSTEPVAVELATPSVSSPGIEKYLPLNPLDIERIFVGKNAELVYMDSSRRGWLEVRFTRSHLDAQWRFVSTVLEKDYTVVDGGRYQVEAGAARLKPVG